MLLNLTNLKDKYQRTFDLFFIILTGTKAHLNYGFQLLINKVSKYGYFLCLLVGCLLLGSCDNEEEPIPAYLHIPKANLTTNYTQFGSADHQITDVWVYANEELLGLYDLPITFPVIAEGPTDFSFEAGILENGFLSVRRKYPFYSFAQANTTLTPQVVDTLVPQFTYKEEASLIINNDFEIGNDFEIKEGNAFFQAISGGETYEGARSGYILLEGVESSFIAGAIDNFFLPQPGNQGNQSYLEINYKNDYTFNIFLTGTEVINGSTASFVEFLLTIPPVTDWNKLYVNLTDAVIAHPNAISYNFGIEATLNSTTSVGNFYYDNIKIIHQAF